MELLEAIHQEERRREGALRRLPGVRDRPEPGQIEMGMAEHVKPADGPRQATLAPQRLKAGDEVVSGSYAAISRRLKDASKIRIEQPAATVTPAAK